MARAEAWRRRALTLEAMGWLCLARALVALAPLRRWRGTLGMAIGPSAPRCLGEPARLVRHVERAAERLPFRSKCLPQAMALSWMLRRRGIAHAVVFAVRPPEMRSAADSLHAWVEAAGERLIGDLPGPWIVSLRLGE